MFELVFLGTSASAPSIHRGLPAFAVLAGEHRFLIDCGEGTQRQILRSGIGFKKLDRVLLTHEHLDHILGLGGLVSTFTQWESLEKLEIWGGRQTLKRVEALIYRVVLAFEPTRMKLELKEITTGTILNTKAFQLSAFPVVHRGDSSFGFLFEEHSRRPFLVEEAEALGIPAGPERGQLVAGRAVTLADGRHIQPDQVLGERVQGVKLVCIGDIGRTQNVREQVQDADTLVIEATFLEQDAEAAARFGHMTARGSAQLAVDCNVKTLILTHVSRRYRESDVLNEARRIFPDTFVARDLDHFVIRRGQVAEKLTPDVIRARREPDPEEIREEG